MGKEKPLKQGCQEFFYSFWTIGPAAISQWIFMVTQRCFLTSAFLCHPPQLPSKQQIIQVFPVNEGKVRASWPHFPLVVFDLCTLNGGFLVIALRCFLLEGFRFVLARGKPRATRGSDWLALAGDPLPRGLWELPHHRGSAPHCGAVPASAPRGWKAGVLPRALQRASSRAHSGVRPPAPTSACVLPRALRRASSRGATYSRACEELLCTTLSLKYVKAYLFTQNYLNDLKGWHFLVAFGNKRDFLTGQTMPSSEVPSPDPCSPWSCTAPCAPLLVKHDHYWKCASGL